MIDVVNLRRPFCRLRFGRRLTAPGHGHDQSYDYRAESFSFHFKSPLYSNECHTGLQVLLTADGGFDLGC